jgi:hypothetical protein
MGFLLGLLGGITPLLNFFTGWINKIQDAKVSIYMARTGATKEVAVAAINAQAVLAHEGTAKLAVVAGSKYLAAMLFIFALPLAVYYTKGVLFDNIWCPWWYGYTCTTPAIHGQLADWMNMIMVFVFGTPSIMGIANMALNTIQKSKA